MDLRELLARYLQIIISIIKGFLVPLGSWLKGPCDWAESLLDETPHRVRVTYGTY